MKRALLTLATAVSMLICLGTTMMWARSYWRADRWAREVSYAYHKGSVWGDEPRLTSGRGEIYIEWERNISDDWPPPVVTGRWQFSSIAPDELGSILVDSETIIPEDVLLDDSDLKWMPVTRVAGWSNHGFGWSRFMYEPRRTEHLTTYAASVPYWFVAAGFAVLPIFRVCRNRRRKAPSGPRCRSCGYDLRGTPDRCPECGTRCSA